MPKLMRIRDAVNFHRFAVNEDLPGVGLMHAAEDFHQGGFARAVFAAKRDDLAAPDGQADIIKRFDAGKSLGNPAHFQQRRGGHHGIAVTHWPRIFSTSAW